MLLSSPSLLSEPLASHFCSPYLINVGYEVLDNRGIGLGLGDDMPSRTDGSGLVRPAGVHEMRPAALGQYLPSYMPHQRLRGLNSGGQDWPP